MQRKTTQFEGFRESRVCEGRLAGLELPSVEKGLQLQCAGRALAWCDMAPASIPGTPRNEKQYGGRMPEGLDRL